MRLYDYAASGNCYKARLLLALLDREYERIPVDIFGGDTLTDEFAALNPVRETPVLALDSGEIIAQSSAILWYLGDEHRTSDRSFVPGTPLERAQVVQWLSFEQERVMSGIGGARFRRVTGREPLDPEGVAARYRLGEEALGVLEGHLTGRRFVVGELPTIADVGLFAYTHVAGDAGYDLGRYPAVSDWLDRIRGLPGFIDDLVPYPANARPGAGRSIYG